MLTDVYKVLCVYMIFLCTKEITLQKYLGGETEHYIHSSKWSLQNTKITILQLLLLFVGFYIGETQVSTGRSPTADARKGLKNTDCPATIFLTFYEINTCHPDGYTKKQVKTSASFEKKLDTFMECTKLLKLFYVADACMHSQTLKYRYFCQ